MLQIIVSDLTIIGLRYKDYTIHDASLYRAVKYLNFKNHQAYSMGGLAVNYFKKKFKLNIKSELDLNERVILRKYFYKQRAEVWELLPDDIRAEELLSIDFNHLYLRLLTLKLPVKKQKNKNVVGDKLADGFYYAEHFIQKGKETSLPVLDEHTTFFRTGQGRGVY
jgi:hypothetical protein